MSLIGICSGKGSPGSTFISVNLSFALAAMKQDVLLMDVDPHGGDLAPYLGLDPRRGLYPLIRSEGAQISAATVLNESEQRGRILCLSGFHGPDETDPNGIADALEAALETDRTVVADFGRVTADTAPMLSSADLILIVVRPDIVGVYGASRAIDMLRSAKAPEAAMAAVITGWKRRRPADLAETAEALKVKVIAAILADHRRARKALAAQKPIKAGPAAKGIRSLTTEVARVIGKTAVKHRVGTP